MQNVNDLENTQQGQAQVPGQQAVGATPEVGVEPGGSRPDATFESNGRQGGPNPEFARRRYESKLSDRLNSLETSVSQLVQALSQNNTPRQSQAPSAEQDQADIWSNPEAYLSNREQKLKQEFEQKLEATRMQARVDAETRMAADYIKSEAGYDSDAIQDINRIAHSNRYDIISKEDPLTAAELAVRDWKQFKAQQNVAQSRANGVAASSPSRIQAMGVNGSTTQSGPKRWTPEEIAQARSNGTYGKYREEILASVKNRL